MRYRIVILAYGEFAGVGFVDHKFGNGFGRYRFEIGRVGHQHMCKPNEFAGSNYSTGIMCHFCI